MKDQIEKLTGRKTVTVRGEEITIYELDFGSALELANKLGAIAEDIFGDEGIKVPELAAIVSGADEGSAVNLGKTLAKAVSKHLPTARFIVEKGCRIEPCESAAIPAGVAIKLLGEIVKLTLNEELLGNFRELAQSVRGAMSAPKS